MRTGSGANLEELTGQLQSMLDGRRVERTGLPRSDSPFPKSVDLERALASDLLAIGFQHHARLVHPRTRSSFEFDFWRARDGVAIEVMGYRADDEIYKDILKFHVHRETRAGVVLVPRWKWVSGVRQDRNYTETIKALAFARDFMDVDALVSVPYDWVAEGSGWRSVVFPPQW